MALPGPQGGAAEAKKCRKVGNMRAVDGEVTCLLEKFQALRD